MRRVDLRFPVLVSALVCALAVPAYAYLDPGAASYSLQVIAGLAIAVSMFGARVRSKVTSLIRRVRPKSEQPPQHSPRTGELAPGTSEPAESQRHGTAL